jgi:hypothetical protein
MDKETEFLKGRADIAQEVQTFIKKNDKNAEIGQLIARFAGESELGMLIGFMIDDIDEWKGKLNKHTIMEWLRAYKATNGMHKSVRWNCDHGWESHLEWVKKQYQDALKPKETFIEKHFKVSFNGDKELEDKIRDAVIQKVAESI